MNMELADTVSWTTVNTTFYKDTRLFLYVNVNKLNNIKYSRYCFYDNFFK